MRMLNRKGFTLVELLAVLVIMIAISAIAIPSISASCVSVNTLLNGGYIDEDNTKDANGDVFSGGVKIEDNKFTYNKKLSGCM